MKIETISTRHLVKSEDLNHHGTLYAGRGAEWMVEAGFMAASLAVKDENVVCLRINSLLFRKPVKKGQMITLESTIVHAGKSSLTAYVKVTNSNTGEFIVDGFFTYILVNENGAAKPHGIELDEPSSETGRNIYEKALSLMQNTKSTTS